MKLFCVFLSFVFVNVIADIRQYMMAVFITNRHIQLAFEHNTIQIGNGLERVIKTMVYDNAYLMDEISVMIAIPEYANLNDIQQSTNYQTLMQNEIAVQLSLPVPEFPNQNFGNLNLRQLGEERRFFTAEALKNITIRALDGLEPGVTLKQLCRIIGVWTSTQIPNLFITSTNVEPYSVCALEDEEGHVVKYRSFEGIYWQVDVTDIDLQIIQLRNLVMATNNSNY
ncbi:uncharacterized protein LOC126835455 [Adelges cooleyi]|uniref:uncharacterized protein LOC126835455 n=1 Tax=Adelges cooleyi TaxID=133065 RepID=UPI00217FDC0A|nr:uncharacterized protein LOC126835455 [Adelges cooleyi]